MPTLIGYVSASRANAKGALSRHTLACGHHPATRECEFWRGCAVSRDVPGFFILIGVAGGARMPSKIPGRDTILYVAISLGLVAIIAFLALYAAHMNRDIFDLTSRWTTIVFTALFAFGFVNKRLWYPPPSSPLLGFICGTAHFAILLYICLAEKQVPFVLTAPLPVYR
jgi:hypothetical protein